MIDTHCHINDTMFNGETEQIINNYLLNGIEKVICVGCCLQSSKTAIELSKNYQSVYCAVGVHPSDCNSYDEQVLENFLKAKNNKLVAIGEIGLDYYYGKQDKEKQKQVFDSQIKLAKKYNLPIIIHCRDAYQDTLEILKNNQPLNKVVMHCYSGSLEYANELLKMGIKFSFTGTVTYKNAKNVQNVALNLPLDSFFFETDSPYLSPNPYRGKRNEPANVKEIYKFVADLRGISIQEMELIADTNAKKFFNI